MPTTPRRRRAAAAVALMVSAALLVATLGPGASPAAAAGGPGPDWVPFAGSRTVWCTMSNPGWSGCQGHHGYPAIDIGMPEGTPVMAAGPGTVHAREVGDVGASGRYIAIAHPDGTYSRYLHLSQVDVGLGQQVARGQVIGLSGSSGSSTSPHLHYDEQRPYGTKVDPGPMFGLVNGMVVEHPATFGQGSWWAVPYGSVVRNDGFPGIFLDVSDDHVFATEIAWAVDHGITTGFGDGTFRPRSPVPRQAAMAFIYRYAGSPSGPFPDPGFTDIDAMHPFRRDIHWAASQSIAEGYDDGRFGALETVSRQAAAAFLYRLAGSPAGPFPDPGFGDVGPLHPFRTEIHWLAASGLTTGYADGTFRPLDTVTRQAATAFLYRFAT